MLTKVTSQLCLTLKTTGNISSHQNWGKSLHLARDTERDMYSYRKSLHASRLPCVCSIRRTCNQKQMTFVPVQCNSFRAMHLQDHRKATVSSTTPVKTRTETDGLDDIISSSACDVSGSNFNEEEVVRQA